MKRITAVALAMLFVFLVPTVTHAVEIRAGSVGWVAGKDGISVTLSPPVTVGPYTVVVQETNAAG